MCVKAFRFRLAEAMLTIVFLAIYFCSIALQGDSLWLPMALVSPMILLPSYLLSLLMSRHYFGGSSNKEPNRIGEQRAAEKK